MTYDHELTLIRQTMGEDEIGNRIPVEDEIGNQIPVEAETTILCGLKSVGRAEFYDAAASGLRPELVFVVHAYEYGGEQVVKFDGVRYNVIRTYQVDFEEMELVCERVVGSG